MSENYFREEFTPQEEKILLRYFTNVDKPVFGLINLPEMVKGALFARYSRTSKSLRRLFLDEFYDESMDKDFVANTEVGMKRASELYDKMIMDFGDDSVAQLGGAHIACEQVSNVLTKVLESVRLASYLEQSTRYIYFDQKENGRYKYMIPEEIRGTSLEKTYREKMDNLFDTYRKIKEMIVPKLKEEHLKQEEGSDTTYDSIIKAKACDIVRGLLPACTKSNLGIYTSGQSYEHLLVKMYSMDNREVTEYADMILEELRKIIPGFLKRVDVKDRGVEWSNYLKKTRCVEVSGEDTISCKRMVGLTENKVKLITFENKIHFALAGMVYEQINKSFEYISKFMNKLSYGMKENYLRNIFGQRKNRRHNPGRGLEHVSYTFEILSDYGAFRDLQRHRMLTIQWQNLTVKHGYSIPKELSEDKVLRNLYEDAIRDVIDLYNDVYSKHGGVIAQYVVPFAYMIRYVIKMNAREAFHLIELRTQKQGHSSYRNICQEMYSNISNIHDLGLIAKHMNFVDLGDYDLPREDSITKIK